MAPIPSESNTMVKILLYFFKRCTSSHGPKPYSLSFYDSLKSFVKRYHIIYDTILQQILNFHGKEKLFTGQTYLPAQKNRENEVRNSSFPLFSLSPVRFSGPHYSLNRSFKISGAVLSAYPSGSASAPVPILQLNLPVRSPFRSTYLLYGFCTAWYLLLQSG